MIRCHRQFMLIRRCPSTVPCALAACEASHRAPGACGNGLLLAAEVKPFFHCMQDTTMVHGVSRIWDRTIELIARRRLQMPQPTVRAQVKRWKERLERERERERDRER